MQKDGLYKPNRNINALHCILFDSQFPSAKHIDKPKNELQSFLKNFSCLPVNMRTTSKKLGKNLSTSGIKAQAKPEYFQYKSAPTNQHNELHVTNPTRTRRQAKYCLQQQHPLTFPNALTCQSGAAKT